MSKDKKKNEHGTFNPPGFKFRKYLRKKSFTVAILAIVFLGGTGGVIYKKVFKAEENTAQTKVVDTRIPGWWYQQYFGSSTCESNLCDPEADIDGDKLSNYQEYYYHTDPAKSNTIGDSMTDGELVAAGFDPSRTGRKTFDQAIAEVSTNDEFLGESLLLSEDIQRMINESVDPTKVPLPKVNLNELNISYENTNETIRLYLDSNNAVVQKYFSSDFENRISSALSENNVAAIEDLKYASTQALIDLKKLSVPSNLILLHQYYISVFELLPDVLTVPDAGVLMDDTNPIGNSWYDKAQGLGVLISKVDIEMQRLTNQYR